MDSIKVLRITVIRLNESTDKLIFHTDLPDGCWPYEKTATINMELASNSAEEYLSKHFPNTSFEVINA